MHKLIRSKENPAEVTYTKQVYRSSYHSGDIDNSTIQVLIDRDGIPALYSDGLNKGFTKLDEISTLSHELLTPLTLIKGYTATLLELNKKINEEQRDRYLRGIESAANRLIRLLENIRDLVQLEEPDSLSYHPASLPHIIYKIVSEMQSQTMTHLLKFRRIHSLPKVNIDRRKIEQVITNLLSNAIKYSPDGTDIDIDITQVRNQHEAEKLCENTPELTFPCLVVNISNSGIGIPETELERVFDRYYRLDNSITNRAHGSGFGLYICKTIIEAHGGHIWVKNKLGGGSTFSFSLSLQE